MGLFDSPTMVPINSLLTHMVYLLPFSSYVAGYKSDFVRRSPANRAALGLTFLICLFTIFAYIPLFVLNKCNTNPKSESGLSKFRRFRKIWNAMPFYHRIICSLLNEERILQSKYFYTFSVVPPDVYDTVWNIVLFGS